MLQGVCFKANPTTKQKLIISQWMGCARQIWNAKCDEERYYTTFARKYYPIGTFAPIDQTTAQFKDRELTPWLYNCPSQIIRNSAVNWYQTFKRFIKGQCGKPKHKPKTDKGSIHLTRELFKFEKDAQGVLRLLIGTKTNNIGYLSFKRHRAFKIPNSIYLKKTSGKYTVSFCYTDDEAESVFTHKDHFDYLQTTSREFLNQYVIGIDRGVIIPAQAGNMSFDFTVNQKKNKTKAERYIKRLQRRLAKQPKQSAHRTKTKRRLAKYHAKCRDIRKDYSHKTSRALVNSENKVFIFEDLKTTAMTKSPKAKRDINGKFIANRAAQKAGLNKAILDKGWYQLETFLQYKALKAGKVVFKVSAIHTSQECAKCGHIHPDNRKSQSQFQCNYCGHIDNADRNASLVIKKRAINLILDTGTVLSDRGVLTHSDIGRGAKSKPHESQLLSASGNETSKKIRKAINKVAA